VALARALVGDPELILADEPTAALDAASGQDVMRLLRALTTGEGKTAVVVTHDPRILDFADRVLHLDNGRIAEAEPSTLATSTGGWR
jgi:putative ABC transport system ATP-binding protein